MHGYSESARSKINPCDRFVLQVSMFMLPLNVSPSDVNPARLEFAKDYAATETFLAPPMLPDETTIAYAKRVTDKWGKPTRGPEGVRFRSEPA